MRSQPGALPRLTLAAVLIAVNWLVYIWAVNNDHVVEAALGYYVNPLISVALGIAVLGEHLRRLQLVALGFGVAAVGVLTVAYGRVPWIALVLACSFGGYGFLKKAVPVGAVTSLAVETLVLLPAALAGLVVLEATGEAAFLHGSIGRDVLLVGLGVVTAVPLLLFGTAARRIPLSLLGLLQYLTPTLQLLCGVLVFHEPMPPGAPGRLRARVGRAGRAGRRRPRPAPPAGAHAAPGDGAGGRADVNFLGHTHVALASGHDDPEYLLGAVLPDLAPMAGVRLQRAGLAAVLGRRGCAATSGPTPPSTPTPRSGPGRARCGGR